MPRLSNTVTRTWSPKYSSARRKSSCSQISSTFEMKGGTTSKSGPEPHCCHAIRCPSLIAYWTSGTSTDRIVAQARDRRAGVPLACDPEGCQSGRMGRPRKPLRSSGLRGFESHSFRRGSGPVLWRSVVPHTTICQETAHEADPGARELFKSSATAGCRQGHGTRRHRRCPVTASTRRLRPVPCPGIARTRSPLQRDRAPKH